MTNPISPTPSGVLRSLNHLRPLAKQVKGEESAVPEPTSDTPLKAPTHKENQNRSLALTPLSSTQLAQAARSMLTPTRTKPSVSPTTNETSASKPTLQSIKAEITDSKFISAEDKKQRHSLIDDFNGMLIGAKKEEAFSHLGKMISTGDGVLASKLTKLWNTAHPENLIG
jgi:hypothetical protein